jgi:hypothetical protein
MTKSPIIIEDTLNQEDRQLLIDLTRQYKTFEFQSGFSRYVASDYQIPQLSIIANSLLNIARKTFNSKTLLPTYTLFVHYEGSDPVPSLYKHKDDNACTYTIDLCLYQNQSWDLWVENVSYTLQENQSLAYYGNDQLHWREDFPNPGKQYVAMIFFHFAEPDHWFFTKDPSYLSVVRGEISEHQWNELQGINNSSIANI